MAAIQDATLVGQARPLALTRRRPEAGLLHHSDRGRTSTSESSQALLQREGMRASRSRTADCNENAARERFFHVSQGHALMASRFRHEHGKGAPPLIPAHVFPIEPGDLPVFESPSVRTSDVLNRFLRQTRVIQVDH